MIRPNENPERAYGYNKFLVPQDDDPAIMDGYRGPLLALSPDAREGIVMLEGRMLRVVEKDPNQWPVAVGPVDAIPAGWTRLQS